MTPSARMAEEYRYNKIFAFLNGKFYILDGVQGSFKHLLYMGRYPKPQVYEHLYHVPDDVGKLSPVYIKLREMLGDDHLSDLTTNIDCYCGIALELGYTDGWQPGYSSGYSGCQVNLPDNYFGGTFHT